VVCAPVEGKKEPTMLASTDENQDDLQHPNHDLSKNVTLCDVDDSTLHFVVLCLLATMRMMYHWFEPQALW